jgi:hypothetical protein
MTLTTEELLNLRFCFDEEKNITYDIDKVYSIKKINGLENLNLNHIDLEGNEIEK